MPSAPSPTVAEFTLPSPSAPAATLEEVSLASPSAPAATVEDASELTAPNNLVPAPSVLPAAVLFEPVFVPELPNAGNLRTVPSRTENGRPVFTSTSTAGELESGSLAQDQPRTGIWLSAWFNGTTWRFDVWFNAELMLYFISDESAFANPWAVPVWYFSDNPGTYPGFPDESWNLALQNTFTFSETTSGCLLIPNYAPLLTSDPLLLTGEAEGGAFYANGEPQWNGESWSGWDTAFQLNGMPDVWIFGELGSGPTWGGEFYPGSGPPIGVTLPPFDGGASGNLRLIAAPPTVPSRAVAAYTAPTPSAPSATV